MKVVLQRPDGLFWVNYQKVNHRIHGKWGTLDVALIEDDKDRIGRTLKITGDNGSPSYVGTWIEYPPRPTAMTPPGFTLEELEEAQRMIEGT